MTEKQEIQERLKERQQRAEVLSGRYLPMAYTFEDKSEITESVKELFDKVEAYTEFAGFEETKVENLVCQECGKINESPETSERYRLHGKVDRSVRDHCRLSEVENAVAVHASLRWKCGACGNFTEVKRMPYAFEFKVENPYSKGKKPANSLYEGFFEVVNMFK